MSHNSLQHHIQLPRVSQPLYHGRGLINSIEDVIRFRVSKRRRAWIKGDPRNGFGRHLGCVDCGSGKYSNQGSQAFTCFVAEPDRQRFDIGC